MNKLNLDTTEITRAISESLTNTEANSEDNIAATVAIIGNHHEEEVVYQGGTTYLPKALPTNLTHPTPPQPVTANSVFDLASLTKVVSTLPCILHLLNTGDLALEDTVNKFIANAGWAQKNPTVADANIQQLLSHSSGLTAWQPFFSQASSRLSASAAVLQSPLSHNVGEFVYSDLSYLSLGLVIEAITGQRQDVLAQNIFDKLELQNTSYRPITENHNANTENIVATEYCGWRKKLLQGTVHDENAYVMDGVAGHAGLFGTAFDLAKYARAWLNLDPKLGNPEHLSQTYQTHINKNGYRAGLGWQLKHNRNSKNKPYIFTGDVASDFGYGHTGFVGTSMWLEPIAGWYGILLTNRVHPNRKNNRTAIKKLRYAFYQATADSFAKQKL